VKKLRVHRYRRDQKALELKGEEKGHGKKERNWFRIARKGQTERSADKNGGKRKVRLRQGGRVGKGKPVLIKQKQYA